MARSSTYNEDHHGSRKYASTKFSGKGGGASNRVHYSHQKPVFMRKHPKEEKVCYHGKSLGGGLRTQEDYLMAHFKREMGFYINRQRGGAFVRRGDSGLPVFLELFGKISCV